MLGFKEEGQVQGSLFLKLVDAADRERIGKELAKAYAGEISHFEFMGSGVRGQIYKSCFVPIKNKNGSVKNLMGITEDITERKNAEEQVRKFAFYDSLTQLPNRRLLNDRLGQAMAVSKEACLTRGFGAELAARIQDELFDVLVAPVKRVGAKHVPMPFSPAMEDFVLPGVHDVLAAARTVTSR